jgi:orotidine-5'-phosphate decarboxylase
MSFTERLREVSQRNDSLLCIGLDPDPELMPAGVSVAEFNRAIVDATSDLVCAYKPNLAFYEALGIKGLQALQQTIKCVPTGTPVIGDAKRGDIGNTARAYARALFDGLGLDAVTVNPYLGYDSVEPFLQYKDKGVFILCRTSNEGALDFQSLKCETELSPDVDSAHRYRFLYEIVALKARYWNTYGNVGLVVGATYPEELRMIRVEHPTLPLLIPGVGAQGGDLAVAVRYGMDSRGELAIINSSRQIIYASRGKDFAEAARRVASELRQQINYYRTAFGG